MAMKATKAMYESTEDRFCNELKSVKLEFGQTIDGDWVAGLPIGKDYIDGYCKIIYQTVNGEMCAGIQDKRSGVWFYSKDAQDAGIQIEKYDNAILVYFKEQPRNDMYFLHRIDTEFNYSEEDDVGY